MTTQRVNIQYSVKIDELEQEIQRLSAKALSNFNKTVKDASFLGKLNLSIESHEQIDELRHALTDIDATLSDVNAIIGAFLSYKSQEMLQQVPRPPQPAEQQAPDPVAALAEVSELQQKIAGFKEKISKIDNGVENDSDSR